MQAVLPNWLINFVLVLLHCGHSITGLAVSSALECGGAIPYSFNFRLPSSLIQSVVQAGESTEVILNFLNKEIKFGSVLNNKTKEAFFNDLSVLLNSGMNLKRSLELIAEDIKKKKIQIIYQKIHDDLVQGFSFNEALAKTGVFDQYETTAVKIGEESGNMENALANIKFFYDREINDSIDKLVSMIQPALTITMGGMIGWITIAVFGPIYATFSKVQ